jgi:two-component system CheB/CheR fusion protein
MLKKFSNHQPADYAMETKSAQDKIFPIVANGMPHSAIAAGYVDFIFFPEEIGKELVRIAKHPNLLQDMLSVQEELSHAGSDTLNKIFVLLRSRSGNDFTYYKHTTLHRRIKRRMVLQQIDHMEDYVKYLQQQPGEVDALFQDILINVTSFFRDPETFEGLKTEVFPRFFDQSIRIWIPGCSTGEEVYSIAIALFEFLGERNIDRRIQIFASDIDDQALNSARQGIYPETIREVVSAARLQRFFVKTSSGYKIRKSIRDVCVFALQNVTKDPPFSRLNLICCRNLMIYFGTMLQKKVLQTFHYALHPGGFLMLGTSETIGSSADLYSLVDKKNKIYLKKSVAQRFDYDCTTAPNMALAYTGEHTLSVQPAIEFNLQHEAENFILSTDGSPGVIVNQDLQIQHFRDHTGPYLESAAGSASLNLLKMARQNRDMELRSAVNEAIKEHRPVRKESASIAHDGSNCKITRQVLPIAAMELTKKSVGTRDKNQDAKNQLIQELEQELLITREYMQTIIGEQDTTNEKLQSTNEALATINEEHETWNQELNLANIDPTGNIQPIITEKGIV